jgi:hypothetical protein
MLAVACGDATLGDDDNDDGDGGTGDRDGGEQCGELCPDAGPPATCKLVDMIIAVDGSSSMTEELVAMRDIVFPAFAQRLPMVGMGLDNFRVGTIDACPDPANYHTQGNGGACNFSSGEVWIDSTSPNLNGEFACVGDLDITSNCTGDNDDEQPASASAASLEPPNSTGPNLGFSRPDSLLVVVAVTDEDEQPTPNQTASEVYQRLVATKFNDPKRIVFLGIGGGQAGGCNGAYGQADEAIKLRQITDLFIAQDRGVWWDLCVGNLEDGLDEAFVIIDRACDELPPIP